MSRSTDRFGHQGRRPGTVRLLRFRGIDLNVHVSLIFLLIYIVLASAVQFPMIVQQSKVDETELWGNAGIWSVIFALALFASVAVHEFAHSLVAQALGVRVRGITLMMLGGVSQIEKMPEAGLGEFKLAIVGPLTSFAIAVGLGWVAHHAGNANLAFFSYWVGSVNFVLAVFNMLPAFPLDGGRALRSLLSSRLGMMKATRISVALSYFLACALGVLGLFSLNLLLAAIAFFIYSAAKYEWTLQLSKGALKGLSVRALMVSLQPLSPDSTLQEAVDRMKSLKLPLLPVQGQENDDVRWLDLGKIQAWSEDFWSRTPVHKATTEPVATVDVNAPLDVVTQILVTAPEKAVPVVENGRVMGIVRQSGLEDLVQVQGLGRAA